MIVRPPYIKPKNFLHHLTKVVRDGIPASADSKRDPKVIGTPEWESFWNDELWKIVNGFQIGSTWIPGFFYYYMNYKQMSTIKGVVTPDMVDLHLELAYHIEFCKANGKNLLCAKGRRKGISEAASTMIIDYGWRFKEGYKGGVAAGNKTYVDDFMSKWRFSDSRLPPELAIKRLVDNDDEVIAGYTIKDSHGAWKDMGTMNTVYARTMHTNPNMFKGLYLNDIISEEIGEHERWIEFYGASKDCLMSGNQQVGTMVAFGTGGNVNKGSKDFKKVWHEAENFNFVKFLIPATRFYFYGGATEANRQLPLESEFYKTYRPYELIGVEDIDLSKKFILNKRDKWLKTGDMKAYNEDLQNNPIDETEIFRKTVVNNFDINKLNEQDIAISALTHPKYTKYKMAWAKDEKGMIKTPLEVKLAPLTFVDNQDECVWIIDSEHPRKGYANLYVAACLLPGEKVVTDRGLVDIELVTLDDKLVNKDGKLVSINELQRHYVEEESVYKIKVSNTLRTTSFTGEHPIYTSKAKLRQFYKRHSTEYAFNQSFWEFSGFDFNKAENVCVGDWIKVPNIYRKTNDFDINELWGKDIRTDFVIDSPLNDTEFWWFIGLWLGDGWTQGGGRQTKIEIAFNAKEVNYINKFERFVNRVFQRSVSKRTRTGATNATFSSKQLFVFLNKHFGKYAHGKLIPEWAKKISDECKWQMVKGYLDSDGSIHIEKKRNLVTTQFISINQQLLEGFQDILFSLGVVSNLGLLRNESSTVIGKNRKPSKTAKCYQLRLGHHASKKLVGQIKTDELDHKLNKIDVASIKKTKRRPNDGCFIDKSLDYIYFQVREISVSKYTGVVYNFDCETHTYMCHHITTHNCDSYDQDVAKASKSLGAMLVMIRENNIKDAMQKAPVAAISCRPHRKEKFYEMCLMLSVYYNLIGNVLIDVANGGIFNYFKENGCQKYLAKRPVKFESEGSQQTAEFGVRLTNFSRPRMVGLMQTHIVDHCQDIWFPELIHQLGNYDEIEVGSDNDLADAYGIALMQDVSCEVKPFDMEDDSQEDRWKLPEFGTNRFGDIVPKIGGGAVINPQEDNETFGLLFGPIK